MNEVQGNLLIQAIGEANQAQLDALWAILKFRNMGILRKVLAMCEVLNLNSEDIVKHFPQDENGRLFDSKSRYLLSKGLIEANKQN